MAVSRQRSLLTELMGETTEIRCESGITMERNKVYYKEFYSETRSIPAGCNVEKAREALWETVHVQIDKQIQAILNA